MKSRYVLSVLTLSLAAGSALAVDASSIQLASTAAAASTAATAVPAELTLTAPELVLAAATAQAAKAAPAPEPTTFTEGWKFNADVGLNGSSGNSENLNLRAAFGGVRKSKPMDTSFGLQYSYATDNGATSKSRGEAFIRNDWNFDDSPWSIFAIAKAEYDEFQAWDWRASLFVGPGYAFIKNDTTLLKGRVGVGLTREVGGPDNDWIPEGDIGVDFTHKLSERTKIYFTGDYYPSLKRFSDYRLVAKAGLEILVDPELALTLKIGAEDRFDSKPDGGFKKNDIDYFILLSVAF
jgi:putative salt-induced outer membrane protein YdiY